MSTTCPCCGNKYTPQQIKEKVVAKKVNHWHEGKIISSKVIPHDDAFFEIVSGRYAGNLVHIWNIVK